MVHGSLNTKHGRSMQLLTLQQCRRMSLGGTKESTWQARVSGSWEMKSLYCCDCVCVCVHECMCVCGVWVGVGCGGGGGESIVISVIHLSICTHVQYISPSLSLLPGPELTMSKAARK